MTYDGTDADDDGVVEADTDNEKTTTDEATITNGHTSPLRVQPPAESYHVDFIDWHQGFSETAGVVTASPTEMLQADVVRDPTQNKYYIYYEYGYASTDFRIGVVEGTAIDGPYDTAHEPILTESGTAGDPDEVSVADPCVRYIPWADPSWRMWFDMEDGSQNWTVGHAYASDPTGPWTKLDSDNDGVTDILIDMGDLGRWDSDLTHAPEVFLQNGMVHCLYNARARSAKGTGYDAGLAIASDSEGLGTEFDKWGRVTWDASSTEENEIRMKAPICVGRTLYATMNTGQPVIGASHDAGRTWTQVTASLPDADLDTWLIVEGTLYGITSKNDPSLVSVWSKEVI